LKINLDRKLPISLNEQIKGQIKYTIVYGQINSGDSLPPVRELANELKVAPMTIARVYKELSEEGFLVSRPRLGTFVADIGKINGICNLNPSQQNLRQILDNSLRQAWLLGYTNDEIRDTFLALFSSYANQSSPTIILVGNFYRTTEVYANKVKSILSDLNVKVVPVVLSELRSNFSDYIELIRCAKLTITVATRLNEVRALLEPHYSQVAAVAFQISPETRQKLSEISPDTRLGIITTYPEFLKIMLEEVYSYGMLKSPPICAVKDQTDQIKEMYKQIDMLLYASGSEEVIHSLPSHIPTIEFLHSPVPESVNRLRSFLMEPSNPGAPVYSSSTCSIDNKISSPGII
jgi:DNA-binding transcriptional regulator YhcF (GntR family)